MTLPTIYGVAMGLVGNASLTFLVAIGSILTVKGVTTSCNCGCVRTCLSMFVICVVIYAVMRVTCGLTRRHLDIFHTTWKMVRVLVSVGGIHGRFKGLRILGSIGISVRGNSIIIVLKPDNSNGAAFLQYLGFLRRTSDKRVSFTNVRLSLDRTSRGRVTAIHGGATFIFRKCGLFTGGATLRGMVLNLAAKQKVPGTSTRGATRRTLRHINVLSQTSCCPSRLSKNRRRHIKVTQTVTIGPSIVLFSRPASTLSPRLIKRILGIVQSLTGSNAAVVIIARRVGFTRSMTARIVFVTSNIVIRRKASRSVFRRPGRRQAGGFLRHVLARSCRRTWRSLQPFKRPC